MSFNIVASNASFVPGWLMRAACPGHPATLPLILLNSIQPYLVYSRHKSARDSFVVIKSKHVTEATHLISSSLRSRLGAIVRGVCVHRREAAANTRHRKQCCETSWRVSARRRIRASGHCAVHTYATGHGANTILMQLSLIFQIPAQHFMYRGGDAVKLNDDDSKAAEEMCVRVCASMRVCDDLMKSQPLVRKPRHSAHCSGFVVVAAGDASHRHQCNTTRRRPTPRPAGSA